MRILRARNQKLGAALLAAALIAPLASPVQPADAAGAGITGTRARSTSTSLTFTRASDPERTVVTDSSGRWVATFTDGSRTVTLAGPERTLSEPDVTARVKSTTWVRALQAPFSGTVDRAWLDAARADRSPDVLALSLQYVAGAAEVRETSGLLVSSDASYGPLLADGTREEGSDWNDYQQVTATYGTVVDKPEARQAGALDCSGFVRMVWGVRAGLPLALHPDGAGVPRRSFQILDSAPGTLIVPNTGVQVTSFSRLAPGDLVFFDAATDDGTQIDHVGMYLGKDTSGRHRFVSSRKSIDGPTMGDYRGMSVLDGTGLYARSFRAVRRL